MKELSVILQGEIRPETAAALQSAREFYPEGNIILSTWKGQPELPEFDLCDRVLFLDDPGPLPTQSKLRNLRRQAVSAHAGLMAAGTTLAIKSRTDIVFRRSGLDTFARGLAESQLAVWEYFSAYRRHNAPYHASDILQAAATGTLLEYWPPVVSDEVVNAGLLPEQWLFVEFLRRRHALEPGDEPRNSLSYRNMAAHCRAFARFIRVFPAEMATLPERLRATTLPEPPRDFHFTGSWLEGVTTFAAVQYPLARRRVRLPPALRRLLSLARRS
jgi:hypothetical protein